MAARKKSSPSIASGTFFTKDLLIFILIMGIVAIVTYILTYNAIMLKMNQYIGANYGVPVQEVQEQLPPLQE